MSTPAVASMSRRRRALTFVVLGGLSAFGPLATDLYLPALPEVGRDLGAGQGVVQLTVPPLRPHACCPDRLQPAPPLSPWCRPLDPSGPSAEGASRR